MRHGSCFTGLGMFDYAAMIAGIETVWQIENNKFCNKLLEVRYPNAKRYGNIEEVRGSELERVDIISGGFPCQPHSNAGKKEGGKDKRNLFPEQLRIIREVKPAWFLGENVYGILNTDDGKFFEQEVITPLEAEGYKVQPYIIPASAIGAVHRRDRIWIVAYSDRYFIERKKRELSFQQKQRRHMQGIQRKISGSGVDTNTDQNGINNLSRKIQSQTEKIKGKTQGKNGERLRCNIGSTSRKYAPDTEGKRLEGSITERGKCAWGCNTEYINDSWIEVAAKLCGVDASFTTGIFESKYRKQRLEGLGNGIQWEIAYIFFKLIKTLHEN